MGSNAQGVTFAAIGNKTYTLAGGVDYSASGGMKATLGDLMTSYNLFSNKDDVQADYIIMGPSMDARTDTQAKAGFLISLATQRKDCVATIGAHKADLVGVTNTTTQTTNLIKYFSTLSSSSYAIFDSGYKYTYDRFNNKFVYIPCNADVAGLMTRTNIVAFPWFSPAGQQRGILNNAIKLAYNPSKAQRDQLYPQRINSIITQPGIGTLLFGDKTALGYASAFDRINVRRLFLTIEQALQRSAEAQLFELNDELTRANFRNIVEPFLRDVQAKRGLFGFLVVCDTTNNTPDVIDNNEFRADIFLKPAKSINFVTLTFVATRTGVSFEEVAGTV
jgi:phage tail sheath protein FI